MNFRSLFHFGHHDSETHDDVRHSTKKPRPIPPDTAYQGAWCGGDGSRPKHDKKVYHRDYGYFSKKTEVASDKMYQQAWV
jgi:hypothetical protein